MDIMTAARQLLESIAAPRGAVTIVPVRNGASEWVLNVWCRNGRVPPNIPSMYQGFQVVIEEQPRAMSDSCLRDLHAFAS